MFARVLRSQFRVDKITEATRTFREMVIPLCRKQRGFKGGYFLNDSKTGDSVIMTLWDSEDDMLANEASHFFQEQIARFIPFYAKPPIREAFEVTIREEAKTS